MTEAAQANLSGLECSSCAWQVRHQTHMRFDAELQGNPATRMRAASAMRHSIPRRDNTLERSDPDAGHHVAVTDRR